LSGEIDIWIRQAEEDWLDLLVAHAEECFRATWLPSHDQSHHLRVWNIGKALLRELSGYNSTIDPSLIEGVLIASLFHDIGMASSTREDHGRLGKEQCESWFQRAGRKEPARMEEILDAIELHDIKDKRVYASFRPDSPPEILGILSVADDLEAMGTIGIYRYAEIYLKRNILLEELGTRVLENARSRFENLSEGCRMCHQLIETYRRQYDELGHFFEQYQRQLEGTSNAEAVRTGSLGVINYIRTLGLLQQVSPLYLFAETEKEHADEEVCRYFRALKYEMEQARL